MASILLKETMTYFMESLAYHPQDPLADDNATYQSLLLEFSHYDDGKGWYDSTCRDAAAMAEVLDLHGRPCTEVALFYRHIPKAVLKNDPGHERDFLQAYRENLTEFYRFWDTIPANCITLATMDFMNASLIKQMPCMQNMKLTQSAQSLSYYLRAKVGASPAFAFMLFPKDMDVEISVYIQVIADIILFTDLANDILSFYKECLAGETNNYIHNHAHVTQKSVPETLQDVITETLAANDRITKVLESTNTSIPWKRYVNGYIAFHVTGIRYRMSDLGF